MGVRSMVFGVGVSDIVARGCGVEPPLSGYVECRSTVRGPGLGVWAIMSGLSMLEGSSTRVDPLMLNSELLNEEEEGIEECLVRASVRDGEVPDEVLRRCIRDVTESIEPREFSRELEADELRLEFL